MFLVWQKNRGKMKKSIDSGWVSCYTINCSGGERDTKYGGIAQLGERLNGIQEVSGSIPLISTIGKPTTTEYGLCGGIAQLGACVIENMPPLSDQQSTTSYSVPYKLPFLEEYGGIAQLGAPANGGNPPRCRETTIQSKSPETLEIQWFPVIWGYSSAGSASNRM